MQQQEASGIESHPAQHTFLLTRILELELRQVQPDCIKGLCWNERVCLTD
jgi:hypothetical protein